MDIDIGALFGALDIQRVERGLSWKDVANEIWSQSAEVNARRDAYPIRPATLKGLARRGNTSCANALFMLRWLGCAPEAFLPGEVKSDHALPSAGPDRRLRWDLARLYATLDRRRREERLTWEELALTLRCTPVQLSGIRAARDATGMKLAMRAVQWLGRPASSFIYPADW